MAKSLDLYIDQGADYQKDLTVKDSNNAAIDITGNTFTGSYAYSYDAETPTGTLTVAIQDAANGVIRVTVADTDTTTVTAKRYVYDIKMQDGSGNITRIFQGILHIKPQVT